MNVSKVSRATRFWAIGAAALGLVLGSATAGAAHGIASHTAASEPLAPELPALRTAPAPPPAGAAAALAFTVTAPYSWRSAAPHPIARFECNGLATHGRLWVLGGFNRWTTEASPRSDSYDPATNSWRRLADMPQSISHAPAIVEGDRIWLFGGFVGNNPGPSTDNVWIYDISDDAWAAGPDLPAARGGGGAALVGRTIHFFGGASRPPGASGFTDQDDHWALDLDDRAAGWQRRADLPSLRNHIAGVALGGYAYAIGGQRANDETSGNSSLVERYDPDTDTWRRMAPLPAPRGHTTASTFASGGRIIVIGGVNNAFLASAEVTSYDPAADAWTQHQPLPAGRKTPIAGEIDDRLVVTTGNNGGGHADTWITTPMTAPAPDTFVPAGGTLVMEAESARRIGRAGTGWSPGGPSGAVGSALLVPNAGASWTNIGTAATVAPELLFPVDFAQAGTYRVWVRANPPNTGADSLHAGLNGGIPTTALGMQGTANATWQWITASQNGANPSTITVPSAGLQSVSLWPREDGLPVDRVVLSTGTTPPTGTGPAETPKAGEPSDTTAPFVTARDPAPDEGGVDAGRNITVTFSERIAAGSVSASTVELAGDGGATLAATRTLNAAGTVLTVNPAVPLTPDSTFTVTLRAGIQDAAGNPLEDAPVAWSFSTPPASDTAGPTVDERSPAPGADGVPTGADVTVVLSEAVDPDSVTSANAQLTGAGGAVAAVRTLSAGGTTLTIDPSATLDPGAEYTVTLGEGVTDVAGNPLQDAPVAWTFTTDAAPPPPGPFLPQGGTVAMEAESAEPVARSGAAWSPGGPGGAVGGAMIVPEAGAVWADIATAPALAPELRFPVDFPAAGTYRVWIRAYPVNGGADSVHGGLDGTITTASDHINNTSYGAWQWVRYSAGGPNPATLTVPSAGVRQVSVFAREDGMAVDRVVLTTGTTAPLGSGPAESPRG